MNLVILHGRLARDPERRTTTTGKTVTSFSVACKNKVKTDNGYGCDFINCVAWEKTADVVSQYFTKGDPINVTGSLSVRAYEDKDGNKRTATDVTVQSVEFPAVKKGGNARTEDTTERTPMFEPDDSGENPFLNGKLPF